MLDVRNNILNLSGNVELSSEQKINIYLEGLLILQKRPSIEMSQLFSSVVRTGIINCNLLVSGFGLTI